jgi:spore germination protein GerM
MGAVRKWVVLMLILLVGLSAGCANQISPSNLAVPEQANAQKNQPSSNPANGNQHTAGRGMMNITVFYPTSDAMYVAPEVYTIAKNDHPVQSALELLLAGPKRPGLVSVIPVQTRLKRISITDHIAYVDFNDKLLNDNHDGSTAEVLLVASIVNTVTEFPYIRKVQLLVDGKKITTISGHMDVSEPLSRAENMIKK